MTMETRSLGMVVANFAIVKQGGCVLEDHQQQWMSVMKYVEME